MKWLRTYVFRSKIFWGYFFLFLGIAVFVISGLELGWLYKELEDKRQQEIEVIQKKAESIALDLDEQMTGMRMTVLKIISGSEFKKYYQNSNAYYKIEFIDDMREKAESINLVKEYFVAYPGKHEIISNHFGSLSFSDYVKYMFGKEAVNSLTDTFTQEYMNSDERLILHRYEDVTFVVFPFMQLHATARPDVGGMFVYLIKDREILDRADFLVGKINGELYVSYGDFKMLGDKEEAVANQDSEMVEVSAASGEIRVLLRLHEEALQGYFMKSMVQINLRWFWIGVVLAFVLAYITTLPIYKLTKKIGLFKNATDIVDWNHIEKELEKLLYSNKKYNEDHYRFLQQQILRLVISGKYIDSFNSFLLFFNIKADYLLYCVFTCNLNINDIESNREEQQYIMERIEELSDSSSAYYPYWESDTMVKILVGTEGGQEIITVTDKIKYFFDSVEIGADIELIEYGNALESLQGKKVYDCEHGIELLNSENKVSDLTQRALEYIQEHYMELDISLENVADHLQITPSYLSRIIKKEVGVNYKEYVTRLKIEKAMEMLLEEEATVISVSEKIGYFNTSYFIKVFRNYTGMTPDRWRKQHDADVKEK